MMTTCLKNQISKAQFYLILQPKFLGIVASFQTVNLTERLTVCCFIRQVKQTAINLATR